MRSGTIFTSEVEHHLNPAFCGALLMSAIKAYQGEKESRLPLLLAYLVLPIVLHGPSRAIMPRDKRTHFHLWITRYPQIRVGLPERCRALLPFTSDGIEYLLHHRIISFKGTAILTCETVAKPEQKLTSASEDTKLCFKAARLIGNWFGASYSVSRIYFMLGVRP